MKKVLYILILSLLVFGCVAKKRAPEFTPIELTYHDTISHGGGWHTGDAYRDEPLLIPDYFYDEDGDGIPDAKDLEPLQPLESIENIDISIWEKSLSKDIHPLLIGNQGTLVYKIDSVLIIGVVSRVEARIIKQISEATTTHLVSLTTHTTTGIIYEEVITVGNIMDMDLKSLDPDAITVNKITDDEQLVDENDVTYWLWSVTANKIGNYNLIMTAKIKEDDPSRDIIIFDKGISVINKPKKKYSILIDIPDNLKRYDENIIKIDVVEKNTDTYNFEWGGEGEVVIIFGGKVTITTDSDNIINDNKSVFNYKWTVTPEGKEKSIPVIIKIVGDYEDLIIFEYEFIVKKNFKESFNKFIDGAVKRWYWLFTALLIPLIGFIRKKYFIKKTETNS